VPRKKNDDEETPRRRRGAAVAAAGPQRSLWLRILLYSPKDMVAGLIAFAACSAIITNALFLQSGPHPAPMFGSVVMTPGALVANPLPRPRPAAADAMSLEAKTSEPKLTSETKLNESRLFDPKPVEARPSEARAVEPKAAEPRPVQQRSPDPSSEDPLANLVKETAQPPLRARGVPRPPAPIPAPVTGARRVAAVQRVLTQYGYGQLKPTGTVGPETRIAIERFERERHLPLTGQVSDRLVRELGAVIGHPID
jgi:hypothetical protein